MKGPQLLVLLALLVLTVTPTHAQQAAIAVKLSADQPAIIMPREDAQAIFDRLVAKRDSLTLLEEKWYAALIVGLGTFPPPDTFLDCSAMTFVERMRTEMGSRYHLGKCVTRPISNKLPAR